MIVRIQANFYLLKDSRRYLGHYPLVRQSLEKEAGQILNASEEFEREIYEKM